MAGEDTEPAIAREAIGTVTAEKDIEGPIEAEGIRVVTEVDTVEIMLRGITTEDTTIPEDIMEGTTGTTIEDMPRMEQPSAFFLGG
jgi:hypothetical protein